MLFILTQGQVISTQQVCHNCLLADQAGSPRWHQGQLYCGHSLSKADKNQAPIYQCQMGFRLTNID